MKSYFNYFPAAAVVGCLLASHSFAQMGNDNPTSVTGEFSGSITTGGQYDPYTGNAKRMIDDIVVPGSIGAYPLKWTRILNTRSGWTNSYNWGLWFRAPQPPHGGEEQYEGPVGGVSYPDGRHIDLWDQGEQFLYDAEGPRGMFNKIMDRGGGYYDLVLGDGGKVVFYMPPANITTTGWAFAQAIVDPYGQITTLDRDANGKLIRVTEPGGRYLQINYNGTPPYDVGSVQAFDGRGNLIETVSYGYTQVWVNSFYHYNLTQVYYDDGTQAAYTYELSNLHNSPNPGYSATPDVVHSCDDVRYAGPMKQIEYEYVQWGEAAPAYVAWGQIKSERNFTTHQIVSQVSHPASSYDATINQRTETRGDGATRLFSYGLPGDVDHYTDFKNQTTYLYPFTDARGNATMIEYEPALRAVKKITHPDSSTIEFSFSDSNNVYNSYYLSGRKDENNHWIYYDRDGNHRIWQTRYPDGSFEQFTYNQFGQVLTHRLTSGGTESFTYDYRGLKTSSTDPLGNVTTYNYFWNDRLQNMVDPYGNATWYDYNQRGQITRVTHQDGSYIENGYNPDGTLAWTSDELRHATSYTYDEYKRVLTVTNPLGQTGTTNYEPWNGAGSLSHTGSSVYWTSSPLGRVTHFAYDENLRRIVMRQAPGTAADAWSYFWYDQVGNLVTTQDLRGYQSNFGYDGRNRKIWAMDALGQVTHLYPDAAGNVTSVQLADGNWESKVYDVMNRVTSDTDPVGRVTRFDYTASGKLWHVLDGNNQQTTFGYDALDRKIQMTYPNGDYQQWGYDANSNLTSRRTVNGSVQYFSYDNRNKPVWMSWSNGADWTYFQHDLVGRVTWIQNPYAIASRGYDAAGRLTADNQYQPAIGWKEVHYEYGSDGEQTRLYLPGTDYDRSYGYDEMGRLRTIGDTGSGGTWFSYSYDAASNETQRYNMFNNVAQNYGRDALGRMSQRHIYSPAAGNISVEHYYYDAMSRLSSTYREEDGLSDSFGYDASGQLTGMNSPRSNRWINYNWDNAGNRTQVNDNGWAYSYGANSLNQYAWTGDGGGVGNGSEHEIGSYQGISYGYYGDRRLASVSGPGGTYNLAYDGLGRTVQRSLNGVTTYYVYDGEKPIYEYKADGSTAGWNVYGKGIDEPLLRADYVAAPGGQGYFYQQDHEGSVTHLTGWGGEVIESYRYDAFGAPTTTYSAGSFNNRFKFTGREYLPQFGIYEYRNRAYHPGLGRFMSEDPSGFSAGDYNLFRYCHNDPVDRTDPAGLLDTATAIWNMAKFFDSSSTFRGEYNDWMNPPRMQAGMDGAGGGNDNGKFYGEVKNFIGKYRPEAGNVSPAEIGHALVEDAQEAAGKTADYIRHDSKGNWGIEWSSARYIKDGHLVKAGPAPGLPYRFAPHALLPTLSGLRPFTGSHSHGPQSEKGFSPGDFASARGQFTHGTPYISSVASSTDRGTVVHIYMAGGSSFSSINGNFFLEH